MADVIACSVRKERISQMHGMEYQFYRLRKDFAAGDIGNRQTKTENLEYSRNQILIFFIDKKSCGFVESGKIMKNYLPEKIITYSDIRGTSTDIEDMEQK